MNMRERMAQALFVAANIVPKTGLSKRKLKELSAQNKIVQDCMYLLADAALDALTANPGDAVLRAPYNDGLLRYGTNDSDIVPKPDFSGEIFQSMIRAIKEGK